MLKRVICLAAVLLVSSAANGQTLSAKILVKAQTMLAEMKESTYDHKTVIDESKGQLDCDCSAFVGYILKQLSPDHYASLQTKGKRRALAFHFYDTFVGDPTTRPTTGRWQPIEKMMDARPGDVLAWRKVELKPGDTTGHVVIISAPPVLESATQVRVEVIDSTSKAHADDTRKNGATGVGRGTVWIDIDDTGKPVGYHPLKRDSKPMNVPISIGRAIESPTTQAAK